MNFHLRRVLALAAVGIFVGEELQNDCRHQHDLYHVELLGYEAAPTPTRQISVDSGSSGGNGGTAAILLPRLRASVFGHAE